MVALRGRGPLARFGYFAELLLPAFPQFSPVTRPIRLRERLEPLQLALERRQHDLAVIPAELRARLVVVATVRFVDLRQRRAPLRAPLVRLDQVGASETQSNASAAAAASLLMNTRTDVVRMMYSCLIADCVWHHSRVVAESYRSGPKTSEAARVVWLNRSCLP